MTNPCIPEGKPVFTRLGNVAARRKVICLHGGTGMDPSYFLPFLEPLTRDAEFIFYKQGDSGALTMDKLVEELGHVVDHFRGAEVYLFGHSFGGALALEYVDRPGSEAISGLILVSWVYDSKWFNLSEKKYPDFLTSLERLEARRKRERIAEPSLDEQCKESFLDYVPLYFTPAFQQLGRKILEDTHFDGRLFFTIMNGYLSNFDFKGAVRNLAVPTLSITGIEDGVVDVEYVRAGLRESPFIESAEIGNAGHFPFIEQPKQFNAIVSSFLNKVEKK